MTKVYNEIELIPINDIIPYWRNPKVNDETVRALVKTIPEHGFDVPLLVDEELVIIKGHARLKALRILGAEKVPCIIAYGMTDEEKRIDRIADNKVHEQTKWVEEELKQEYKDIGYTFEELIAEDEDLHEDSDTKPVARQEEYRAVQSENKRTQEDIDAEKNENGKFEIELLCPHCMEVHVYEFEE